MRHDEESPSRRIADGDLPVFFVAFIGLLGSCMPLAAWIPRRAVRVEPEQPRGRRNKATHRILDPRWKPRCVPLLEAAPEYQHLWRTEAAGPRTLGPMFNTCVYTIVALTFSSRCPKFS